MYRTCLQSYLRSRLRWHAISESQLRQTSLLTSQFSSSFGFLRPTGARYLYTGPLYHHAAADSRSVRGLTSSLNVYPRYLVHTSSTVQYNKVCWAEVDHAEIMQFKHHRLVYVHVWWNTGMTCITHNYAIIMKVCLKEINMRLQMQIASNAAGQVKVEELSRGDKILRFIGWLGGFYSRKAVRELVIIPASYMYSWRLGQQAMGLTILWIRG